MNEAQREFLLDTFFESRDYPGARSIGASLIDKGHCIVAGDGNIWLGGVGNFIENKGQAEGTIGCTRLEFDVKEFVNSDCQVFVQTYNEHMEKLYSERVQAKANYDLMDNMIKRDIPAG